MVTNTKTDQAWEELCAAAESSSPSPALAPAREQHPFAKLGPAPYRFEGVEHAERGGRFCALCGKSIRNLYIVVDGKRALHTLGSECILNMGNGFERALVAQVRTRKREFDRQKRAASKAKRVERDRAEFGKLFPKELAWIESYRGDFDFYLSLRSQLQAKGTLSDNQVAALTRAVERDAARAAAPKPAPREFSLKAGETIVVTKFLAHKIGEQFGLKRPHFALEVVEVQAESAKAWKIRAKLSAQRTINCVCCGAELSNAESRANGIGPICAEKWGVVTVEDLRSKFEKDYADYVVEFWIPKSQVKERKAAV